MKTRFQFQNFFVTTLTSSLSLTTSDTGTTTIPLATTPTIQSGKFFYILLDPSDSSTRMTLKVFMDGSLIKCNNIDIPTSRTYPISTEVNINCIAEMFNEVFEELDDFGKVKDFGGLNVRVFGGNLKYNNTNISLNDITIAVTNNATTYIVVDFTDNTIKNVSSVSSLVGILLATVTTVSGNINTIIDNRSLFVSPSYSENFFEFNTGELLVKIKSGGGLNSSIDGISVDNTVVRTSGNYTIGGTITFSNTIVGNISGNAGTVTNGVYTTRTISTGDGLSGGGDLSANRTLSVDNTVVRTSGNQTIAGEKTFNELVNIDNLRLDGNTISSTDTNGNILLTPNGTGFVGIGTIVPGSKLDVRGGEVSFTVTSTNTTGAVLNIGAGVSSNSRTALKISGVDNETTEKAIDIYDENGGNMFYIQSDGTSTSGAMQAFFNGRVGIGSGSSSFPTKLFINDTENNDTFFINSTNASYNSSVIIGRTTRATNSAFNLMRLQTDAGTDRFVVTGLGRVTPTIYGNLSPVAVTIASGVASISSSYVSLTGEGSASDDLVTIAGNVDGSSGNVLFIYANQQITIKTSGNIRTIDGSDYVIPATRSAILIKGNAGSWNVIGVGTTGSGSVTSVGSGTGLTGGPITTSGTLSIDTGVVATLTGSQTLTNKTINGSNNTITNISLSTAVTGTLPVANGGTGQTTYTNGQLLIGNTTGNTLTKATLTAGSGISITNGGGSITIATTGTITSTGYTMSTARLLGRTTASSGSIEEISIGSGLSLSAGVLSSSSSLVNDVITFTRNQTDPSGTVNYTHNLGVTPKVIIFTSYGNGNPIGSQGSFTTTGSNKNYCLAWDGVNKTTRTDSCIAMYSGTSIQQQGEVTAASSTDFTITWTEIGSPSSLSFSIIATLIG